VFSPFSIKPDTLSNAEGGAVIYFTHLKERKKGSAKALGSANNYITKNPTKNQNQQRSKWSQIQNLGVKLNQRIKSAYTKP